MKYVYLLWLTHSDEALLVGEDIKLVGVKTSIENAEMAQSRAEQKDFKDHFNGSEISCNLVDKDGWPSGFITVT